MPRGFKKNGEKLGFKKVVTKPVESKYKISLNYGPTVIESKANDIFTGIEQILPKLVFYSGILTINNGKRTFSRRLVAKQMRQLKNKSWRQIITKLFQTGLGER